MISPLPVTSCLPCLLRQRTIMVSPASLNQWCSIESSSGLEDLNSATNTDDEDNPKKKVPKWAEGHALRTALLNQCNVGPDVVKIFTIEGPDLFVMFGQQHKRWVTFQPLNLYSCLLSTRAKTQIYPTNHCKWNVFFVFSYNKRRRTRSAWSTSRLVLNLSLDVLDYATVSFILYHYNNLIKQTTYLT